MKRMLQCWGFFGAAAAMTVLAADPAKGVFLKKAGEVQVVNAYAHLGKAEFGDEPVIHVHLSTRPLDHAAIDAALDRDAAFAKQAGKPEMTLYVDPKTGRWSGTSYDIGPGNNCGYCSTPNVPGAVLTLEGGTLKGHLSVKPTDYKKGDGAGADIQFELPISAEPQTSDLGADGGEPGRALVACLDAVAKKDGAAFRTYCGLSAEGLDESDEGHLRTAWMIVLSGRKGLKLSALKVTGGRTLATEAEVFVEGKDTESNTDYKGSIFMKKTPAGWAYSSDRLEAVY